MPNHSGFPAVTSRLVAKQSREDYRKRNGTNPPKPKELVASMKVAMEKLTAKDIAALAVSMAEADVVHYKMFSRTPMERIEAQDRLVAARKEYAETPGQETPPFVPLRQKVCDLLGKDASKKWKVKEIAEILGHPAEHVGVVVGYLRKEGKADQITK